MLKKILSVFLCLVCVFTMCFISHVKSQAIFVVDDAVMLGIAISVCASIALSVGLGVASGQGSVYADTAEYILYHLPTDLYNFVLDQANYAIINGKLTLVFTKEMWDRFKNWFANTDLSNIPLTESFSNVSVDGFLNENSGYPGYGRTGNINSIVQACTSPYNNHTLHYDYQGFYVSFLGSNNQLLINLPDGTVIKYSNVVSSRDLNRSYIFGITIPTKYGYIPVLTGNHTSFGQSVPTNDIGNVNTKSGVDWWDNGNGYSILGTTTVNGATCTVTTPEGITGIPSYSNGTYKIGNQTICTGISSSSDYTQKTLKAGGIISNVSNDYYPVNSNVSITDYTRNIETKPVATAIPRNSSIENDEVLVLPIRSNLVDPSNPSVPLTKGQVKEREKEGLPIGSTIPAVPNMSTETGKDQGVTIIAGRDVLDDTPVYNPAYPSVINPGNETITVTANNDVFPTHANPGNTEAFPTEVESAIVKTGEIVSDIAKDIVTPLTPDDVAKGGNRLRLPTLLLQKFPFCIPYDLYNAFGVLLAEPEAPNFDWPIKLTSVGIDTTIHIDFSRYEDGAKYIRWFLMALWTVALIMLTRKVIWR